MSGDFPENYDEPSYLAELLFLLSSLVRGRRHVVQGPMGLRCLMTGLVPLIPVVERKANPPKNTTNSKPKKGGDRTRATRSPVDGA